MTIKTLSSLLLISFALSVSAPAQTINASQAVVLEGLRSQAGAGSFVAAAYAPDGGLVLLYDQHDGVRLVKADATGATVVAQAQVGAAGDTPVAMALDAAGNVYVAGTTTSGTLRGTSGAAFGTAADSSTNSFVAKFDAGLNLVFLTFLGAGRTAVTGVAATADAVFVTGVTYSSALPVTAAGVQQAPAKGSSGNGFVERFSVDGTTLVYATYLTGMNGTTTPAAIAADAADDAYVAGLTTSTGYPTVNALQARMLGGSSGFLSSLNAAGSAFGFSTFIAGGGLTGMALDASSGTLLLTGSVSLGQFPVATVAMPLTSAAYQTLLRIPVSGQSVSAGVVLAPGSQSFVGVGTNGSAWVAGALGTPLFAGVVGPDYSAGDSFLVHVTAANAFDQTLRLGGAAVTAAQYASLTSTVGAPAVSASGTTVTVPGKVTATVDASLLATERFDLPMVQTPSAMLPNTVRDVVGFSCSNSSQCSGSGGLVATVSTAASAASLSVASDDLPNLTLRNMGSATAMGLVLAVNGYSLMSDCGATLAASSQCSVALTGSGPGTLTVSTANTATVTVALGVNTLAPNAIAVSTRELDFGIVTSVDGTAVRTVTVTNLSASSATFASAQDGGAKSAWSLAETASTCGAGSTAGTHTLAAGANCTISLGLTPSSTNTNDGPVRTAWKLGTEDVVVTGFAQAAAVNVSASEVDFGTVFVGGLRLPRYLYLSNNSNTAVAHTAAGLPAGSAFSVTDGCPAVLEPHTVCQMVLNYAAAGAPSSDSASLALDNGVSVLLTGETLPQTAVIGSAANPNLSVSTSAVTFGTAVAVTQVSGTPQIVTLKNTGGSAFALTLAMTGDFTLSSGCPATLAAGASCSVSIGFAPSQPGTRDGLLSVTAGSGYAPAYVALTGTGSAILPANDGTLTVGESYAGEPVVAWYQVQQPIASLTAASNSAAFGVALVEDTGSGHGTLPADAFGQSATIACANCWLGVQFLAQTAGAQVGQLTLSSNAGGAAYGLGLAATALPVQGLLLSPIAQDFGPVPINSASGAVTFTLANLLAGAAGVTVQSVAATGDFTVSANTTGGASCAGTLAATAACFVQVVFSPTATGARTGTLTVATSGGTVSAALTGFGLADPGVGVQPESLTFNAVPGSAATTQTVVVSNTGAAALTVGQPTVSDPSFAVSSGCGTLAPGALCTVVVVFTPQTATTAGTLSIPVTQTVNGQKIAVTYTVALTGAYTVQNRGLEILPSAVNFGAAATGAQGGTRTFTLNNLSGKALAVSLAMPREFPLAAPAGCATLAAGASCSFAVSFLPATSGALTGTVVANGVPTDGSAAVEALGYMLGYGAGDGVLTVSEATIPNAPVGFGQVSSGQSAQQTLTLTNSGTGSLTIRRLTTEPPFYSTSTCGASLAVGASCAVMLTYAPVYEVTASTSPRQDSGVLTIESDAASSPDAVALSGTAAAVVSASPVSAAVLDAYSLSESALTFANTQVGDASSAQTVTVTNMGSATVHVMGVSAPADFSASSNCGTLLPGSACTISAAFTPTAATSSSARSGAVAIQSDASTSLEYISVIGTTAAAPVTVSPVTLDFGTVNVGMNDALTVTVSNTVSTPVMITSVSAIGDYAVTGGSCPASGGPLAGGASCTVIVTFAPTLAGTRTGTLSVATNATQLPLTVSLTGVGVQGQLQVTPGALAFGSVAVGAPSSLTLTLLNVGSATVTGIGNAVTGANAADFAVTVPCNVTSLAPNQGCTETVTFTPKAAGARAATLTVASSDPAGPALVPLTGTGVAGVAGSFLLTVNGGTTASATVASGSPAVFPLALTPVNGYTGAVALTCSAVHAGLYATCSVAPSTLTLSGGPLTSAATVNTITSMLRGTAVGMSCLLGMLGLGRRRRRSSRRRLAWLGVVGGLCAGLWMTGCGGTNSGSSKLEYTPAGTYQYQVTASSTSGIAVSSTVTLNVAVQ